MEEYEFNERNILQLKADLTKNLLGSIDVAIMKVWDNFTHRFNYTDYSKNIHYYNGWKTNKAFKCNRKVIIPLYAFDHIFGKIDVNRVCEELADIEKAMNYIDCGRTEGCDTIHRLCLWQDMIDKKTPPKFPVQKATAQESRQASRIVTPPYQIINRHVVSIG